MKKPWQLGSQEIKQPIIIAVEGADYFHFLMSQLDGPPEFENVQLLDFGGVSGLSSWLTVFKSLDQSRVTVEKLGVIRDAEADATGAAEHVKSCLRSSGYPVPSGPDEIATAVNMPSTSFLIVPVDQQSGCLEDACLNALVDEEMVPCAETFLACVDRSNKNDAWRSKVKAHALISGSDKPALTLGQSARAGLWDFNAPSLKAIIDFVRKLCA